jgi:2-C-methyl-D-erythritol 4-phosphate cytidylyltransferase
VKSVTGVWTIVVAAGEGRRFGAAKQYAPLAGCRVLDWSLRAARPNSEGVVLVVPPDAVVDAEPAADVVVGGGASRSASVRAGLAAVPADAEVVVVHDAVRPMATPALFASVVEAVRRGAVAAVPAVAVADTLRRRDGGTVDRTGLVAVQTPQAFAAAALRAAHRDGYEATDDAALVEAAGGTVTLVEGEPANRKITDPGDLALAERLVD